MRRIGLCVGEGLGVAGAPETDSTRMYDDQRDCLRPAFARAGLDLVEVWWRLPGADWSGIDGALALSAWDYQDHSTAFLAELERLSAGGLGVFNPPDVIRWNIRKTYLRDLERTGVPVIPTLWPDEPAAADIARAFEAFGVGDVVLKRQVGAGARGQQRFHRGDSIPSTPLLDRPGMIQPFLPAVADEGEYSFLFVDGEFSHGVIKRARPGDYRIQPRYGGASEAVAARPADLAAAQAVLHGLGRVFPDVIPLYARIDMARGADGRLLLMELELIEPYLFVGEGPGIGRLLAEALARRLG
jgi:glutathione synthase/RimK-type ligase-like ATP-grasp enzyme